MANAGIFGSTVGYSMSFYIPIIKNICTSSFVIVSGGWCLIALSISYWLIDVMNFKKFALFFSIVGMNPLFIYLLAHTVDNELFSTIAKTFINAIFGVFDKLTIEMALTITVWTMMWGTCYFLYKRKVFIKL